MTLTTSPERHCFRAHRLSSLRWRMDNGRVIEVEPERFEEMVAAALDGLPAGLGRLMSNVAVTVEHRPGPPGLLGLYEGVPLTSRTTQYAGVLPDRITIYRQAICALCRTEDEVADQVRRTVVHEVAHHFGIDDARLRELGWLRWAGGLCQEFQPDQRRGHGVPPPLAVLDGLAQLLRGASAVKRLGDHGGTGPIRGELVPPPVMGQAADVFLLLRGGC